MNPHWTTQLRVYHLVCLWLLVVRTLYPRGVNRLWREPYSRVWIVWCAYSSGVPMALSENYTLVGELSGVRTRTKKIHHTCAYNESLQADREKVSWLKLIVKSFFRLHILHGCVVVCTVFCPLIIHACVLQFQVRKKEETKKLQKHYEFII